MDTKKLDDHPTVLETGADGLSGGATVAGRYKVIAKIGSGCVSDVYKVCDISTVATLALKVIRTGPEIEPARLKLFEHNARLNILHPHLITVHACGLTEQGEPWLALEHLPGRTLADVLAKEGHLSLGQVLPLFKQICDACGYLHNQCELHMNLKPTSILLLPNNDGSVCVKISDAGFAKLMLERELHMADERAPAGNSALYMSPEQFNGENIDARCDVYAIGCLLYHCLVGRPPHEGVDLLETMDRHLRAPLTFPSEPEVSMPLQAVIARALNKEPDRRYRSVHDLLKDLVGASYGRFPQEEELYVAPTSDSYRPPVRGSYQAGKQPARKGHEPWVLLLSMVTVLLFVLIFQQSISIVQEINDRQSTHHGHAAR